MPSALTYPGVYIEEVPSGVRTITGVSTSTAAFAGWAPLGPTDRAGLVLGYTDFARKYGGLDSRSVLGYAVNQFFANGGQQAYIVRLVDATAKAAKVTLDGKLLLTASSEGLWGNDFAVVIKKSTFDATKFRLTVANWSADPAGVAVEVFDNLSMKSTDARFVTSVLADQSAYVTAAVQGGATDPPADTAAGNIPDAAKLTGGVDGAVLAPNDPAFETALQPVSGTGGLYQLDRVNLFNLLCVPGETSVGVISNLQKFCHDRRAFLIADSADGATLDALENGPGGITGDDAINAALYFPWITAGDPLQQNRPRAFPPCGFVAGIYARTDATRGVWKAPAGSEASVTGALGVNTMLTNSENGVLNPLAINCIRNFPVYGTVVWGARTLQGNDERGSEWKYVPVRRTALFIEESLYRGTQWVVFEPNDEPLWSQIRLNLGAFMQNLFRQGAFQGKTPNDAYFVKCDKETTTQNDINLGIVNIVVGFAPLKPAEFVVIQLQQMAGQIQS
ncbi:phage tail sheath subtilisin-like domain-containing protein [Rhodanobacter sp. T12-5]|uniref:phage tail sheath family protein n=1 Tax=Rhodanobacter sp. T12-5 TaxID=2024611 RepID=UPI0011EEF760|nr:phage tail sheath subtilisin-like domain-containing protein [Rhodanobacter sp. T12-5]KAA0068674.1 phage tail sheath family protein [Rhodanobacter sp. T12-5]